MKLLATDFDNTLKRKKVYKSDLKAIAKFRKEGNKFGIATARGFDMIKDAFRHYRVRYDFLIGINGGIIMDHEGNILDFHPIAVETANAIMEDLLLLKNEVCGFGDGIRYAQLYRRPNLKNRFRSFVLKLRASAPEDIIKDCQIATFFIMDDDPAKLDETFQFFQKKYPDVSVTKNGTNIVNISDANATKAKAVDFISNYYGIDETYVIGDSANDLDMIEQLGGFAISMAEDAIKEAAKAIFDNFTELINYIKNEVHHP